jgi:hypothetical protein
MLKKDDGEYPPTLEEWRVMTRHATRNLTDDPIGAHMRRRVLSDAIPEEPWRLRNVPVDGERTVEQAAALRGRKAMVKLAKREAGELWAHGNKSEVEPSTSLYDRAA